MIDIHSHILVGVDDGPRVLEEALATARAVVVEGITDLVATPHYNEWAMRLTHAQLEAKVAEVQTAIDAAGIPLKIWPGQEAHLLPNLAKEIAGGNLMTLNRSRYLLLEFPGGDMPVYADQVIFELRLANIVPVIAHPERYRIVHKDPNVLAAYIEKGMLAQLTASALVGGFGSKIREIAEILLTHNLVHVLASDVHGLELRLPLFRAGVEAATVLVGRERALEMVTTIPKALLQDKTLPYPDPLPYRSKKSWFSRGE